MEAVGSLTRRRSQMGIRRVRTPKEVFLIRLKPRAGEFYRSILVWLIGLQFLLVAYIQLKPSSWLDGRGGLAWRITQQALALPANVGILLPFAAFAGGVALCDCESLTKVLRRSLALVLAAHFLTSWIYPTLDYVREIQMGVDVEQNDPFGPSTPIANWVQRDVILENPPEKYSLSVGEPFRTPPNWLSHLIHSSVTFPLYAVFSALIGWYVGRLTGGLSPPARKNARWAVGVGGGALFMFALVWAGEWTRADISHSGALAAWAPLLVPLLELAVIGALAWGMGLAANHTGNTQVP